MKDPIHGLTYLLSDIRTGEHNNYKKNDTPGESPAINQPQDYCAQY